MARKFMPWYVYVCQLGIVGRLPLAPGTWGSLVALLVYWGLHVAGISMVPMGVLTLVALVGAIPLCNRASLYMAQSDPKNVVVDELVGQWIALFPYFWMDDGKSVTLMAFFVAFLFFRFFDVFNVYPINLLERLQGGWGIVLDDCLAGVYANICMILFAEYIPW